MKNMEQLQNAYEREMNLAEQHKKKAADIRKQMEFLQGKNVSQKINALNMSGAEYDKFMKLLGSGKKTVFEAIESVLGATPKANEENNIEMEGGGKNDGGDH